MGSGKTFWTKKMSEKFFLPCFNIDEEIEEKNGLTIPEIFNQYKESYFRNLESNVLLNTSFDGLIATGGGIVEIAANRIFLKKQITVWINPDWETIYSRIKNSNRPLVKQLSEYELYLLWERRKPLYKECASYVVSRDIEKELLEIFLDLKFI